MLVSIRLDKSRKKRALSILGLARRPDDVVHAEHEEAQKIISSQSSSVLPVAGMHTVFKQQKKSQRIQTGQSKQGIGNARGLFKQSMHFRPKKSLLQYSRKAWIIRTHTKGSLLNRENGLKGTCIA